MQRTLADLCQILDKYGMSASVKGDAKATVSAVATLENATEADISFLSNPKYLKTLQETKAAAVVVRPDVDPPEHLNLIVTADPYAAITALIVAIHGYRKHPTVLPKTSSDSIAETAKIGENAAIFPGVSIDDDAKIGSNAVIYPGCYIGPRVTIGDDVTLYPNVVIYDDCILGNNVTIHAGTVIGNDGLGYAPVNDQWVKIPQIGIARIGDNVEIGSNCSIDRGTLSDTVIGSGTKMSNLIAIGHGAQIGEDCMIVAQVGLAGSASVGKHVTMAGQVGVVGHIHIGDNATIGAQAGVVNDVPPGETYLGAPAGPMNQVKRQLAHAMKLPKLSKTVKQMAQKIAELEKRLADLTPNQD